MSVKRLQREFDWFRANQKALVRKYRGRVLVIKGQQVIGTYESPFEAVEETKKTEPLGSFLVQRCEPGPDCYTATYHGYGRVLAKG